MFDLICPPEPQTSAARAAVSRFVPSTAFAFQPGDAERRESATPLGLWLSATLDEVDYGMLLISEDSRALHVNHAARVEMMSQHPLRLIGLELRARLARDAEALTDAVIGASQRGLRKLLTLGEGAERVSVSVVPLRAPPGGDAAGAALLILGKRQVCETLSVQAFARSHGLTPAETRVLTSLRDGMRPSDIARRQGVAISTVRSQIVTVRTKTGTSSIRALLRLLSVLPPMMGVLRGAVN